MRLASNLRVALATLAAVTLAACGRESTGPDTGSRFAATVTGEVTRTLTGTAFAPLVVGDRFYDIVLLSATTASDTGVMITLDSFGSVGAGTHAVGGVFGGASGDFTARYYTRSPTSPDYAYYSTGGTVVIEAMSATRVRGHFDVTLAVHDSAQSAPPTVHVVGTFDGPNDGRPSTTAVSLPTPLPR